MTAADPLARADSLLVDRLRPSPNHGARRAGARPSMLLLHYTGMPDGDGAIDWLCDPRSQVSCHYVVDEAGSILQLVAEERRAWHAGRAAWAGETDINAVSIGIEIVNAGHDGGLPPFPSAQVEAVIRLCRERAAHWGIGPAGILAHSDVSPGRKRDPGERFPWAALAAAGVGVWVAAPTPAPGPSLGPGDSGPAVAAMQRDLAAYGYGLAATGSYDAATAAVVRSLQLHFRQARVDGLFDPQTAAVLAALLARRAVAG